MNDSTRKQHTTDLTLDNNTGGDKIFQIQEQDQNDSTVLYNTAYLTRNNITGSDRTFQKQ